MVGVQARGQRIFKTIENRVRAGDICCPVVRIQKNVEQIVPEVHLPIPARRGKGRSGNGMQYNGDRAIRDAPTPFGRGSKLYFIANIERRLSGKIKI